MRMTSITTAERLFYAQIHPLRLAVTAASVGAGLFLLSRHSLVWGSVVAATPTLVTVFWLARRGGLDTYRRSPVGAYVRRWMTPFAHGERVVGFILACVAAWGHSYPLMAFATALVAHAWTAGLLIGRR